MAVVPGVGSDRRRSTTTKKKSKAQNPKTPIKAAEWTGWECTTRNGDAWKTALNDPTVATKDLVGMNILEGAELLNSARDCPKREELQTIYKDFSGEDPPERWGRVDLIVAIGAGTVSK